MRSDARLVFAESGGIFADISGLDVADLQDGRVSFLDDGDFARLRAHFLAVLVPLAIGLRRLGGDALELDLTAGLRDGDVLRALLDVRRLLCKYSCSK